MGVSGMGRKADLDAIDGVFPRRVCALGLPRDLLLERSSASELNGVFV